MLRNVIAVIVGFAVWSVLWVGGGAALQAAMPGALPAEGPVTSAAGLALVLALSIVCSLASGACLAAIVRAGVVGPAVALGGLLLAVGIAVQASAWDRMPLWYHLSFLALLVPLTLVAAVLFRRQPAPRLA